MRILRKIFGDPIDFFLFGQFRKSFNGFGHGEMISEAKYNEYGNKAQPRMGATRDLDFPVKV
jgi:hypothetical protein